MRFSFWSSGEAARGIDGPLEPAEAAAWRLGDDGQQPSWLLSAQVTLLIFTILTIIIIINIITIITFIVIIVSVARLVEEPDLLPALVATVSRHLVNYPSNTRYSNDDDESNHNQILVASVSLVWYTRTLTGWISCNVVLCLFVVCASVSYIKRSCWS